MKRKVSMLLAFVMFITSFHGLSFAAVVKDAAIDFKVGIAGSSRIFANGSSQNFGILEEAYDGIQYREQTDDKEVKNQALAYWNINGLGKYNLQYHLLTTDNKVAEVNLEFEIDATNKPKFNFLTNQGNISFINKVLSGTEWKSEEGTTPKVENIANGIQANFKVKGITVDANANGDNRYLDIKALVKGEKIYVQTSGIAPGNIIDFKLTKDGRDVGEGTVFNQPNNLTMTPTHLHAKNGKVENNKEPITYGIAGDTDIQDKKLPGSMPGVRVSFDVPKQYDETTGTFVGVADPTDYVRIILRGKQDEGEKNIRMEFQPTTGSAIILNSKQDQKVPQGVQVNGSTINIDIVSSIDELVKEVTNTLTKENKSQAEIQAVVDYIHNTVVEWNGLDSSMIIDNLSFEYILKGNAEESLVYSKYGEISGYTYIEYLDVKKISPTQVRVTFKPYYTDRNIEYEIRTGSSKNTLARVDTIENIVGTETKEIIVDVKVNDAGDVYMRIDALIDNKLYPSQIIVFNPELHTLAPSVPSIDGVDDIFVVSQDVLKGSSDIYEDNPGNASNDRNKVTMEAIGMDLNLNTQMSKKDVEQALKQGKKLYYELYVSPKEVDLSNGSSNYVSKIFELVLEKENIVVKYENANGEKQSVGSARFNNRTGAIEIKDLYLKTLEANGWEQIIMKDPNAYSNDYIIDKDSQGQYTVPNNYYLAVRTIVVDEHNKTLKSEVSVSKNVSLDYTVVSIPVPSIKSGESEVNKDYSKISQEITYKLVDIQEYVDTMLTPATIYLGDSLEDENNAYRGELEIFISQDKNQLINEKINDSIKSGNTVIVETTTKSALQAAELTKSDINKLRNGETLGFKIPYDKLIDANRTGKLRIEGLDDNTTYYVAVRVKLKDLKSALIKDIDDRYSNLSSIYSFTTTTAPTPPSVDDKTPIAPKDIEATPIVDEETGDKTNSVNITWDSVVAKSEQDVADGLMNLEEGERIYYELIRTDTQEFDQNRGVSIEKLIGDNSSFLGFRTGSLEKELELIQTYKNGSWSDLAGQLAQVNKLRDDELKPNTVYYYYVRTVLVVDGEESRSTWIMTPYTTAPISSPKNLEVLTDEKYNIDPKTELVIGFDAPISNVNDVPQNYDFEIAIKAEDEEEYTIYHKVQKLEATLEHEGLEKGYSRFIYKVYDLKPNTKYNVKVRMIDKTQKLEDGSYPTSLYTNIVAYKTDYDEATNEADEAYKEYIKIFEQAITKIKNKSYWVVEDDSYKYREEYLLPELNAKKEYDLVIDKDAHHAEYYLPASVIDTLNENGTILNIKFKDQTVSVRPNTLTNSNQDILDVNDEMSNGKVKDYYVKISVDLSDKPVQLNGQSSVSPIINVNMEIVTLKTDDDEIEYKIMDALDDLVDHKKDKVINKLKKELEDKKVNKDELQDIVDLAVEDIEEEFMEDVSKILDKSIKDEESITTIDKSILITTISDSYAVDGYYYVRNWIDVETFSIGNGFAIEANRLGKYVFIGQAPLINTVPSLAPYQSFIAQYNLTDFFTLDSYSVQRATTNEQVYGAVARIMGAPRGTDYCTYLEGKGIKGISKIRIQQVARQDQTIYVVMQAYEKMKNKPVTTIMIKNKQGIRNIGAFQPVYRNYVYAAVELGIVNNPNSQVLPSKQLSVQETIEMLYKMQQK